MPMRRLFLVFVLGVVCLSGQGVRARDLGNEPVGKQVILNLPKQPWQERRAEFFKAVAGANKRDPAAIKELDGVLTEFETHPMSRTPMENMDILGAFYVPKDGVEKPLVMIAENAALGWYDAMRFGSEYRPRRNQAERTIFHAHLSDVRQGHAYEGHPVPQG